MEQIERVLNKGNVVAAENLLTTYYEKEHKQAWLETMQAKYEVKYPTTREMTAAEKIEYDTNFQEILDPGNVYPQVAIDYSEDDAYLTFDEWLNETKVVTDAVPAADGTPAVKEVTELVRPYTPVTEDEIQAEVDAYEPLQNKLRELYKAEKESTLEKLTITTNTVMYDANGKAIGNMSAVVNVANWKYNQAVARGYEPLEAYTAIYKNTKVDWIGADNKTHTVAVESICEALEASMLEVATVLGV